MNNGANPNSTSLRTPKTVFLETFGCQMNELDSELVRGQLSALGYRFIEDSDVADVVLYNTCSVRQQAENKVLSRIGLMRFRKEKNPAFVLGVIGCMAEREGVRLLQRHPHVDVMCGPGELDKLPMLIDNAMKTGAVEVADRVALQGSRTRRSSTLAAAEDNLELLDLSRAFDPDRSHAGEGSAYVRITRGCNKFCTYCVVPYTRGPEVHRPPDSIVDECKRLADQGVIEVTLLGQTVNHYIYTHGAAVTVNGHESPQVGPGASAFAKPQAAGARVTTFADLLKRIHDEVPEILRLRFVTSFPRDFGDDILHVMAESPRICNYLHVPAQSGSNRILKLMNRGYTTEEYIEFIDRARDILPNVSIAGDIIVGFPTETDEDFEMTKGLLRRVRYKNCFIFKYSPRPGTTAIKRFEDDVPESVKRQRNNDLLQLQSTISEQVHAEMVGRDVDVFVERVSQRAGINGQEGHSSGGHVELRWEGRHETASTRPGTVQVSGRTEGDLIAVFDVPEERISKEYLGRIVSVRVMEAGPLLLRCGLGNMGKGRLQAVGSSC